MGAPVVELPLMTVVDGRTWHLFTVEFDTADGLFTTYIYALSHEHAELMCAELRIGAKVAGQLRDIAPWK